MAEEGFAAVHVIKNASDAVNVKTISLIRLNMKPHRMRSSADGHKFYLNHQ